MNGTRFVVLLAALAIVAVAAIARGLPSWGASDNDTRSTARESTRIAGDTVRTDATGPRDSAEAVTRPVIDRASTGSADSAAAWSYRRTAVADLDADAVPERLVIASDVFVTDEGEPTWGDAHRWAVYAEEDDGTRTLLYSAVAPPGGVAAAVGSARSAGPRPIAVVEQSPRHTRLLLVVYEGPGRSRLLDEAGADVAAWADRVAGEAE